MPTEVVIQRPYRGLEQIGVAVSATERQPKGFRFLLTSRSQILGAAGLLSVLSIAVFIAYILVSQIGLSMHGN